MERTESPLIVITGPTASGKTALAIELAKKYGGEIICADSRTVYKGMDIGTAKPSVEERSEIPHWGLDLVLPGERFTAADFKEYASGKIQEIQDRGRVPFLVGGTGLYVDAVIFDYQFGSDVDLVRRRELEMLTLDELQKHCYKNNIKLPQNSKNKRHLIRAIEQGGLNNKRRAEPISTSVIVGIATERTVLRERIAKRAEQMLTNGVVEEAIMLGRKYGWESEAMTGNIYPLVRLYLEGMVSLQEVIDKFTTLDWRLAKRQLTWLRRNPYIHWGDLADVRRYILGAMSNTVIK